MGYTFNGPSKLIVLTAGTTSVSVKDMYSRWKDWMLLSDNCKYLPAFSGTGGDPLPGGVYLGDTYFLENGWKIRPQEANHALTITGNLYSRDGSSPLVPTVGSYNVIVTMNTSSIINTVSTGGNSYTLNEIADAVWDEPMLGHTSAQTMGRLAQIASSVNPEMLVTAGTSLTVTVDQIPAYAVDDYYMDCTLVFMASDCVGGLARIVTGFNATTKTFTFNEALPCHPDAGDTLIVMTDHVHPTDQIAEAVLAAAQTTPIKSDIKQVNSVPITGSGVPNIDEWRPA